VAAASATATVTTFNASYSVAGIVGIIVKSPPDQSHSAISVASNALKAVLGGDISPDNVTKAKNKIALAVLDASSA
jgi:hypothetical protein